MSFSKRYGYTPAHKVIQRESIDDDLKNSLWNEFRIKIGYYEHYQVTIVNKFCTACWYKHFKKPVDTIPIKGVDVYNIIDITKAISVIRSHFFNYKWFEIYDFIEFFGKEFGRDEQLNMSDFYTQINEVLEREFSAYRFVSGKLVEITDDNEIEEIDTAISLDNNYTAVSSHIQNALLKISDRQNPDYRNSIKESISAVEAMSNIINGEKSSLGEALKKITENIDIHIALKKGFDKIYGYTSDEDGIRHAMMDEKDINLEDARYMLVACSAFVNYLKVKADKASII